MRNVYVGHPAHSYAGDVASLVDMLVAGPMPAAGWTVQTRAYVNAGFDVRDFRSWVLQSPGPVVLLRPVQQRAADDLRDDLKARVPVYVVTHHELASLHAQVATAIADFSRGEPQLPREQVVAFLLMRKLDKEHMWGGNAKGYMWGDDIRKGRGVDEKFAPNVPTVLNALLQNELLTFKTSKSSRKYALNQDRREEIYSILRDRRLPAVVEKSLKGGSELESIRALDVLEEYAVDPRSSNA